MIQTLFGNTVDLPSLILRLAIGTLFIIHGYPKLTAAQRAQGGAWMKSQGMPAAMIPLGGFVNASRMMRESGFGLKSDVKVAIDPQLPFMGYSMPVGKGYRIVVSGGSVGSGMLEGLMVHEMSHIYRMENNHVSHDAKVIEGAIENIDKRNLSHDYQQKIVHDLLNDIQDLYADDSSMKVLKKNRILNPHNMHTFLQH